MEGPEPGNYEDTGESGEAYDAEIESEIIRRREKRREEALTEERTARDHIASKD